MSYHQEKSGDIVIDGFDQGIAASPHKGIANIQGGNISTENGEVMASFNRVQQSMTETAATGSLAYVSTDHVSLSIANTNNLFKGNWITVTGSSNTTQLPNGTYYVPASTGANFQLSNYWNTQNVTPTSILVNTLIVAGGGGGASNGSSFGGGGGGGGVIANSAIAVSNGSYPIVVGAGGGATTNGSNSSFNSLVATGGGAGGGAVGATGGSGGGGGDSSSGGVASQGSNGGGGSSGSGGGGGGGGGFTGIGGTAVSSGGGGGGAGFTSTISGSSVSYAGGGGGSADANLAGAGTGGGGAGARLSTSTNATAGTANTGGGGGGGVTTKVGAAGGSGVVIIVAPVGQIIATGGTHTVVGGNDIWTFTSSGTWVPTIQTLVVPPFLTGFTAGLTATIQLQAVMGKPLAAATETYFNNGTKYNRYYILDNQNLVWVYDTQNEVLYSPSDNVNWFLPDYQTNWCTAASGIGVLDGFLIVAAQSGVYGKPVVYLGGTNSTATTWAEFVDDVPWNSPSLSTHFCYVGHQGNMYITDGNYIRNIFPDSTLIKKTTGDNVQSLASWTVDGTQTLPLYGIPSVISGDLPFTSDEGFLPVIFFTKGNLPFSINANQVYYIKRRGKDFQVYADTTMSEQTNVSLTGNASSGATTGILTAVWPYKTGTYYTAFTLPTTDTRDVLFTNGSTSISWAIPLTSTTTNTFLDVFGTLDLQSGTFGTQYYSTFYPTISATDYLGSTPQYVITPQRLTLPNFEIAQCMAEIGNLVLVGCLGGVVYPWDQVSNLPSGLINVPESNTVNILTVNQMAYLFSGNKGNIYITDGSTASLVIKVSDYVAGVPGSPATYVEPYFTWGGAGYVRGRIYFSILDQTATKTGNCGGIWSFVPTQNLYIGQDTGIALRLENQSSYNTYNGVSPIIITRVDQIAGPPLYWSAWQSSISSPLYGIDYTGLGTNASFPVVIETDAIPTGTLTEKKTFSQIEYKLSTALDIGATVTIFYRKDLTAAWKTMGPVKIEANRLSGYFSAVFEKSQWLQLQVILIPITSSAATNSFVRLSELRLR
jgi:hypothetical protein